MTTIKDYVVQVYWDKRGGYFVAEIPEILTCAADGPTQAEAMANLEEAFVVMREAYAEDGLLLPKPNSSMDDGFDCDWRTR
jgi:predicted RNase H-like HicB family nuclease